MPEDFDRRGFIRRASIGAAAVGALTVAGSSVLGDASASAAPKKANEPVLDGSDVIAHVVDARTGEMSILVGEREVKVHNRDLAQQVMRVAR
jgi:hypothetical protein